MYLLKHFCSHKDEIEPGLEFSDDDDGGEDELLKDFDLATDQHPLDDEEDSDSEEEDEENLPPLTNQKTKRKKAKPRNKKSAEVDDSRPEADKTLLQPLQLAKLKQRQANQQNLPSPTSLTPKSKKMATTTRSKDKTKSKETAKETNSDGTHVPETDDDLTTCSEVDKASTNNKETVATPNIVRKSKTQTSTTAAATSKTSAATSTKSRPNSTKSPSDANGAKRKSAPSPSEVTLDSSDQELDFSLENAPDAAKKLADFRPIVRDFGAWDAVGKLTSKELDQKAADHRPTDSKLKKEKKSALIHKLRRQILGLQCSRGKDLRYLHKLEQQVLVMEQEACQRTSRSKAAKLRICEDQVKIVKKMTKEKLWASTKFIGSTDELEKATEKVLDFCNFGEKTPEERDSWVVTYSPIVKQALNEKRNYLTAELKKTATDNFLKQGKELPKPGVLVACAMRAIEANNEAHFKWYWTKILPKVVSAKQWNAEVMYYHTIGDAKHDMTDPDSMVLFTVSHEAMICLVWENNWQKWQDQYQWKKDNPGKEAPKMPGKWTTSDKGQMEWGGWDNAGLEQFNSKKKMIRAARRSAGPEKLAAFEQKMLAELRQDVGIDCDNHDLQLRKNRAKKRKLNAEGPVLDLQVHKKVSTVDSEDEDEVA